MGVHLATRNVAARSDRRFNVPVRSVVLALAGLVLAAPAPAATVRPALRSLSFQPLTVQGLGFRPNERVTLLLAARDAVSKRVVRAGVRGRFTVRYELRIGRCTGFTLQAFGSRGSRAMLQHDTVDCAEP
jgi:hypothetical protein